MELAQKETQRPMEENNISLPMYHSLIFCKSAKSA